MGSLESYTGKALVSAEPGDDKTNDCDLVHGAAAGGDRIRRFQNRTLRLSSEVKPKVRRSPRVAVLPGTAISLGLDIDRCANTHGPLGGGSGSLRDLRNLTVS